MLRKNEVKALTKYLGQELQKELGKEVPLSTKHPSIYGIMEEAKAALNEGRINDAIRMVVQLETLADRLKDSEKRAVTYDVMELKTNIKLATLS